jgi:hypothetical protein
MRLVIAPNGREHAWISFEGHKGSALVAASAREHLWDGCCNRRARCRAAEHGLGERYGRPQFTTTRNRRGQSRGARLGYGSHSDPRRGTIFRRFRNEQINHSEALSEVRQWRRQRDTG